MKKFFILCVLIILLLLWFLANRDELFVDELDQLINKLNPKGLYLTIRNPELNIPIQAAEELAKLGPKAKKAVPALVERLQNGEDEYDTGDGILFFRVYMANALGKIGDPVAIKPLAEAVRTSKTNAQASAIIALSLLEKVDTADSGIPVLIESLKNKNIVSSIYFPLRDIDFPLDGEIRDYAIVALKRIGQKAVPLLEEALKNKETLISSGASQILAKLKKEKK